MSDPSPLAELMIRPIEVADSSAVAVLTRQLGYERTEEQITVWIQTLPQRSEVQAAFVACIGSEVVGWIEIAIEHRLQSPPYALIGGLVVKDGSQSADRAAALPARRTLVMGTPRSNRASHVPQHTPRRASLLPAQRLSAYKDLACV